jgi:hypothetical protein
MISQYLPAASVYGLNAMGIKGKVILKIEPLILATSYLLVAATTLPLKKYNTRTTSRWFFI